MVKSRQRERNVLLGAFLLLHCALAPLTGQVSVRREFVFPSPGLGVANAVAGAMGGGLVAAGYTDAGGQNGTDVLLVRFDPSGDTLWTRMYGEEHEDFGWDVVAAPDGGFFVAGFTEAPSPGREDVLLLRVDASGAPLWRRTLGGAGRERAWSAVPDGEGGLVVAAECAEPGRQDRDACVFRVDGDGSERWTCRIEAPGDQRIFHAARADDGTYRFVGTTAPDGEASRDVYVVALDSGGQVLWTRSVGGPLDDVGHGVSAGQGGSVLVTGYGASRSTRDNDLYLLELDGSGELLWWRDFPTAGDDRAMMSVSGPGTGVTSVGYALGPRGADVVVWESDASGALVRRSVIERPGNDRGVMIAPWPEGGWVVAGTLGGASPTTGDFAVLWLGREP